MSDYDDDTPPEALFFTQRALKFPIPEEPVTELEDSILEHIEEDVEVKKTAAKAKDPKLPKGRARKGRKRLMKDVDEIELVEDLDEFDVSPTKDAELPSLNFSPFAPAVKRRLKQIHTRQANELKKIVAENSKILSETRIPVFRDVEDHAEEEFSDFILTISFFSKVSRLRCSRAEKFISIFPKVADLFNLKASEFLLCLNNCNINLDDTPESLNITFTDVIECLPYKGSEAVDKKSDDTLKIYFQSENSKEKVHLFVHKLESMQDIMQKYSELKDVPIESLVFEFDGEIIQGSETPLDLDMESGNCIDVKTKTKPVQVQKNIPSSSTAQQIKSSILSYFVRPVRTNAQPVNSVDSDIIFIE